MVTMDISSLYTSIPNQAGLRAVEFFLPESKQYHIPSAYILECLEFVLENNEDSVYKQIRGTVMGSSAAPTFANLFVGYLEYQHYTSDMYIWEGDTIILSKFVKYLNSIFPGIVFNPEISDHALPFVDVLVSIRNAQFTTSVYTKPTDKNTILHYSSAHPTHMRNNLPVSQFLICIMYMLRSASS